MLCLVPGFVVSCCFVIECRCDVDVRSAAAATAVVIIRPFCLVLSCPFQSYPVMSGLVQSCPVLLRYDTMRCDAMRCDAMRYDAM